MIEEGDGGDGGMADAEGCGGGIGAGLSISRIFLC